MRALTGAQPLRHSMVCMPKKRAAWMVLLLVAAVALQKQWDILTKRTATGFEDVDHSLLLAPAPEPEKRPDSNERTSNKPKITPRNRKTLALVERSIKGGFRNQVMRLTAFVMHAVENDMAQILLPSIVFRDCTTNSSLPGVPFEELFDVDHWNSFHPDLPLLVPRDPEQHHQWNSTTKQFNDPDPMAETDKKNKTSNPYAMGKNTDGAGPLWWKFKRYSKKRFKDASVPRSPVEIAMFQALRPCKRLMELTGKWGDGSEYFTIHARVEPDMLSHHICPKLKIRSLSKLFYTVEQHFPNPPAQRVFIPINKFNLLKGVEQKDKEAIQNLATLEMAEIQGLWNGTVTVFEVGSQSLSDPFYDGKREISGSVLNFFLAVQSKVFIGTEVSTWSTDVWTVRYHQGRHDNYKYFPGGVENATVRGVDPKPFMCLTGMQGTNSV